MNCKRIVICMVVLMRGVMYGVQNFNRLLCLSSLIKLHKCFAVPDLPLSGLSNETVFFKC